MFWKIIRNHKTYSRNHLFKIFIGSIFLGLSLIGFQILSIMILQHIDNASLLIWIVLIFAVVTLSTGVLLIRNVIIQRKGKLNESRSIIETERFSTELNIRQQTGNHITEKRQLKIADISFRIFGATWIFIIFITFLLLYDFHKLNKAIEWQGVLIVFLVGTIFIFISFFLGTISFVLIMPNFISELIIKKYLIEGNVGIPKKIINWILDKFL